MFERRILRGLMLAMGLALVVALLLPTLALADKGNPPGGPGPEAVGHVTISGNPLTIHVAADTSIQVFYAGQTDGQVYPPNSDEAISGGFAWLGAAAPTVWGPSWAGPSVNAWTPAPPQLIWGAGTAANPWWVETIVDGPLGPLGVSVWQWVRYVNGEDCFTVSYIVFNFDEESQDPITFFQAADLHVDGDDNAYGFYDPPSGAVGGWNKAMDFLEYLVPLTTANGLPMPAADHYQEADYLTIWPNIFDGVTGFNDTIRAYPDWHDSACGLQWDLWFPGGLAQNPPLEGNFVELAADWCFLQEEEPEFVPEPGSVMLLASGLMGLAGYAGLRKWRG